MIDAQGVRVAALSNQVPIAVFMLELALAALLVSFLLLVIADLDRPTRGMIRVPDTPLRDQLASMQQPPAAGPASSRRELRRNLTP
jgi:hypothetical protein